MVSINNLLLVSLPLLLASAEAGRAPANKDSPRKVLARAHLDKGKIKGIVEFSAKDGVVKVHIDVTGLPEKGGPFYYHIHKNPVPENGNCEGTGTHFNPYDAPSDTDCDDFDDDSLCQVGDLSGKHGFINTTCFEATYKDPYLSLNPKNKAYIVGLAVTLHYADMTKIACGTIEKTNEKVRRDNGFLLDGNANTTTTAGEVISRVSAEESYYNQTIHNDVMAGNLSYTNGTNGSMLQSTYCDDANMASVGVTGFVGVALGAIAALI